MQLNSLSKHGIIVAIVTALCALMLMISKYPMVRYALTADDDDYVFSTLFLVKHVGTLVLSFVAAALSGIMMWGILKHRHMLLVPWLVFSGLIFVMITFIVFYQTFSDDRNQIDDYLFCLIVMGFGVIVIYPLYILYLDIHRENMEITEEIKSNPRHKI